MDKNYFQDILKLTGMSRFSLARACTIGKAKGTKNFPEKELPFWHIDEEQFNWFKENYNYRKSYHRSETNLPNKVFTPKEAEKLELKVGTGLKGKFNEDTSEIVINFVEFLKFVDYLNPDIIIDRNGETMIEFIPGKPDILPDEETECQDL